MKSINYCSEQQANGYLTLFSTLFLIKEYSFTFIFTIIFTAEINGI